MTTNITYKIGLIGVAIFAVAILTGLTYGGPPKPEVCVSTSNFIAVGSIIKKEDAYYFRVEDILKGSRFTKRGEEHIVVAPWPDRFNIAFMMDKKNAHSVEVEKPLIFVGNYDPNSKSVVLIYNISSIWPKFGGPHANLKDADKASATIEDTSAWIKKQLDGRDQ